MKKQEKLPKKKKDILSISIEDEEGIDGWPLPAIVPVVFSRYNHKTEAECYFGVYSELRAFFMKKGEELFTREALDELDGVLAPYLEKEGYERPATGRYRYYYSFVLWQRERLNESVIRKDSVMLTPAVRRKIVENPTDFDLDELLRMDLPTAVTVKNGTLLSLATVNPHGEGQRLLEAAVYTLPQARKNGYGSSNTALLCREILKKKMGVVYCCSCYNRGSLRIAKSLGFKNSSRFYAVDAYKIEKK